MKYTGYTKAELIEWCQCLEHNYNVEKERFERVSSIVQKEAIEIVELRRLLEECRPALNHLGKWNVQRQNLLIRINTALGECEE